MMADDRGWLKEILVNGASLLALTLVWTAGAFISLLQCLNYVLFYHWKRVQRPLNTWLQDLMFSAMAGYAEILGGCRVRIFADSPETLRQFGRRHSILLGNHRYEVDFLLFLFLHEEFGRLGSMKAFLRHEFRYVPVSGWALVFGEYVFLRRDWRQDRDTIGPSMDRLMAFRQPWQLLLLPEGTRFTREKHLVCQTYAKQNGIPFPYRYHLLPRVKGFAQAWKHLRSNYPIGQVELYNVEFMQSPGSRELNLKNFLTFRPMTGDIYLERIAMADLPGPEEDQCATFLYQLFQRKDDLWQRHQRDPMSLGPVCHPKQLSRWRRIRFYLLVFIGSGGLLCYLIYIGWTTENQWLRFGIFGAIAALEALILTAIATARISNHGVKRPVQ